MWYMPAEGEQVNEVSTIYGVVLTSFTCSPSAGPISLKSAYTALPLTYTSSTLMLYPDVSFVPYPATI